MNLLRRLQGYWLMIHPFPVIMVIVFATILTILTARPSIDVSRIVRAIMTLFFSQVVVGVSNDYHDRNLDARTQPWKPLVSGVVKPSEARALIISAFILMILVSISLGPIVLTIALLGTLVGLLYDFWLRETPFSWVPYVVGFLVLLVGIWTTVGHLNPKQLLIIPIGIPLLLSVHLAQTLPDVETDMVLGVRGFAVTVGRQYGVITVWGGCFGAQILTVVALLFIDLDIRISIIAICASFLLVVLSMNLYYRNPTSRTLRMIFRLITASAVILATGLLAAIPL